MQSQEIGEFKNITATGDVGKALRPCKLFGFYVNSTASGTLVMAMGSGGTALGGTITPAIGYHAYPADCPGGLHATIGNTLDVTFFIQPYGV